MLSKLSVKRQWFQTAAAKRKFPALVAATGAVLEDKDTGKTVRVRVAGRAVTMEETRAAACGSFCAADVDERYRTKVARRVSMSHELSSDVFDPSCAHVPDECVLGEERSYESSCVVDLESPEQDGERQERVERERQERQERLDRREREDREDRKRIEREEREERERLDRREREDRERQERKGRERQGEDRERQEREGRERQEREQTDARVLEVVKQLFDRALYVSRHVPVIRLPLASVTFHYLCEAAPPRAVLERLGERYLATLQSALRQSEGAREMYASRCVGSGANLQQEILDGTWE